MLSSPENQGAELPPGAGLISCAVGRFTGLGGRPLPPQQTDTASLLVPWDTWVSAETSLVCLKDLTFSHFGQSRAGTEARTINVRTWVYPLLTSQDRWGVVCRVWGTMENHLRALVWHVHR